MHYVEGSPRQLSTLTPMFDLSHAGVALSASDPLRPVEWLLPDDNGEAEKDE